MIQLSKEEILFSLPLKGVLASKSSKIDFVSRPLIFGHVCPHCETLVQALFESDKPIEEVLQEHFQLEEEYKLTKFAVSTEHHQVQPKFTSKFIALANGKSGQLIMEDFHFNICETALSGRCKYSQVIFRQKFDPVYYAQRLINIETQQGWHPSYDGCLSKVQSRLAKGDEALAKQILEKVKTGYQILEDVAGKVAPVYLMGRSDWTNYVLEGVLKAVLETVPTEG